MQSRDQRECRDDDAGEAAGDETAHWFVRLQDDDLTFRERRAYLHWLRASPVHVEQMLRMGQICVYLRNIGRRLAAEPIRVADEDPPRSSG